jgi:hypothetical protein
MDTVSMMGDGFDVRPRTADAGGHALPPTLPPSIYFTHLAMKLRTIRPKTQQQPKSTDTTLGICLFAIQRVLEFWFDCDLDVGGSDGDANMYSHCPWEVNQGLGKYEAAFRVNDIDQTVLPNLTAPRSGRRIGPPWMSYLPSPNHQIFRT